MIGASIVVTVTSAACRVANAEAPSGEPGPSQNRRRDRRTYQLDRSSMSAASRRPAAAVSNASRAAVTSRTHACTSDSSHRSSSGREPGTGASAASSGVQAAPAPAPDPVGPGPEPAPTLSQPRTLSQHSSALAFAYSTRNDTVFQ